MCFLCERAVAQRLGLIGEASVSAGLALSTDPVPTQVLISNASAQFSKQLVAPDGVMDLYLHTPGGAVQVDGGGLESQTIQALPISPQDQAFIVSMVTRLDSIIDLDFVFVNDPSQADTLFYYDQEIEIDGDGITLGLAISGPVGWELFINYPAVVDDKDFRQYVNLHEWGHSLGLEHPFEVGDGDVYANTTDPSASAYPEQTVMAYRSPDGGDWPNFFTTSDLNALIEIWGAEPQWLTPLDDQYVGAAYRDVVYGGEGRDVLQGEGGGDWLDGGSGDDILAGGLGADVFRLSIGNDWILDYSYAAGDLIEIQGIDSYALSELDGNLQIETALGITSFSRVSASEVPAAAIQLI